MTTRDIQDQLRTRHAAFMAMLDALDEEAFLRQPGTAWTAGQQWAHIVASVSPVALAFALPKWGLRMWMGKSTRPSRSYDALVARYLEKLAAGGRASGRFVPKPVAWSDKARLRRDLDVAVRRLIRRIGRFSEAELDTMLLPHPLLGKLTLREMLFFTVHHVEQHHHITLRNLGQSGN